MARPLLLFLACAATACARVTTIAADRGVDANSATPVASSARAMAPPPVPAPADDDLREATFRYMFRKNASGVQQNAKVYCLHLEKGADPPAAFLARFAGDKVPVRAASACSQSVDGVFEKATHAHGLAFRIDGVTRADADHATVTGGYYEAGLSASGNVYTLERKGGAWSVTKDEMQWIS